MNPQVRENSLPESSVTALVDEICPTDYLNSLLSTSSLRVSPDSLYEGCLVTGSVLDIRETNILIDFGYKSEGILPFKDGSRVNDDLDIGDQVSVLVSEISDDEIVYLTRQNIEKIEKEIQLVRALAPGQRINGNLVGSCREGWIIDIGFPALLPFNQSGLPSDTDLSSRLPLELQVTSIDQEGVVLLTRRPILEELRKTAKESFLTNLQVGDIVTGTIKNITDFGAFIQIASGVIGLCYASDLGSEPIQNGQQVLVKILKFDREKNRVSLGIRQVNQLSWEDVVKKYHPNDRVQGVVSSLAQYGAFVEIEPGVQGLVHISDLSWSEHLKHPKEIVQVGQTLEVIILDVDEEKKRLSLGLKQATPDPWDLVAEKYLPGSTLSGTVFGKAPFGLFVELEKGVEGLVSGRVGNLEIGQPVEVTILKVDPRNRRINLSL